MATQARVALNAAVRQDDDEAIGRAIAHLQHLPADTLWKLLSDPSFDQTWRIQQTLYDISTTCGLDLAKRTAPEAANWDVPTIPWCAGLASNALAPQVETLVQKFAGNQAFIDWSTGRFPKIEGEPGEARRADSEANAIAQLRNGDPDIVSGAASALWHSGNAELVQGISFEQVSPSQRSRIGAVLSAWADCRTASNCSAQTLPVVQFCSMTPGSSCQPNQDIDDVARRYLSPAELEILLRLQQNLGRLQGR